ncbi:hypothetical protein [Leifsonia sp. Le1]|uniref:hypothetical protein n=1 Tax=Leifsonia sp. Le1 TaxID=3404918 RepID=UPI003EBA9742
MSSHTEKTYAKLTGTPAPRDLEWSEFVTFWEARAEETEQESGDRLAVTMNGHREVFRRPHDGRVSIEDVERARHLLAATPDRKGHGALLAIAVTADEARIFDFDLDAQSVTDTRTTLTDHTREGHHLRTVERHTGHDDESDLIHYFDAIADTLRATVRGREFIVIGHGTGKANVAEGFVERLRAAHHEEAALLRNVVDLDLSAATDADIEDAALAASGS